MIPFTQNSLSGQRLNVFPLRLRIREGCLLSALLQHSAVGTRPCNKAKKEQKAHRLERKTVELFLFADNVILYIENPKETTWMFLLE